MPSDWYGYLRAMHGEEHIAVGPVPELAHHRYWISSTDEEEPTNEEHRAFYEGARSVVRVCLEGHQWEGPALQRPYIVGDFFGCRTEMLAFDPRILVGKAAVLRDLLLRLQAYVQKPENRRWRIGFFDGEDSVVVFPDRILVGPLAVSAGDLLAALTRWLDSDGFGAALP
jgi:hypothetical protein